MKTKKLLPSIVFLIIANLVPLYGALVLGWNIFAIVLSYCLETFAIGVFHVFKMLAAKEGGVLKFFMVPFFIFHYNMFVLVQTFFVVIFMSKKNSHQDQNDGHYEQLVDNAVIDNWWWFPLILMVSHLFSFFFNYIGKKEYKTKNVMDMMIEPYGRIFIQQFTVIGGAFLMIALGSPIGLLLILIVLKIAVDLISHIKEHNQKDFT